MLEENRGVLERENHHLRTSVKDGEQQVARLTEDLNISQQKLERLQDVQNWWIERSKALVEQLQAQQNRTILAEQAVTNWMIEASLNSVASHVSLGPQTLEYESTRLDGLVSGGRRFESSPIPPD